MTEPTPPPYEKPFAPAPPTSGNPFYEPRPPDTSRLAVWSLVLAVLGICSPLALVLAVVALVRTRRNGQRGRGLAIGAIVISALWLVGAVLALVVVGALDMADRDESGNLAEEGKVAALDLRAGDCLEEVATDGRIGSVEGLPCSSPHRGEVFAVFDLPKGGYPGEDALTQRAEKRCTTAMQKRFPRAWKDEGVGIAYLVPARLSWKIGDRTIVCIASTDERTGSIGDGSGS